MAPAAANRAALPSNLRRGSRNGAGFSTSLSIVPLLSWIEFIIIAILSLMIRCEVAQFFRSGSLTHELQLLNNFLYKAL
jgi:hypothetical protein